VLLVLSAPDPGQGLLRARVRGFRERGQDVGGLVEPAALFRGPGEDLAQRVDWESALQELQKAPIPVLFLTISERAYLFICDPAGESFLTEPGGEEKPAESGREAVRQALATSLTADWPPCIQGMIDIGRLRQSR
jgi:hypothetical protein